MSEQTDVAVSAQINPNQNISNPNNTPYKSIKILNKIVNILAKSQNIIASLEIVLELIVKLYSASYCAVVSVKPNSTDFTTTVQVGPTSTLNQPTTLLHKITQHIIKTEHGFRFALVESQNVTVDIIPFLQASQYTGVLALPLLVEGRIMGGLIILVNQPQRFFSADDWALADTIAIQISTSLEKEHLRLEVQHRAREIITLAEVGREISLMLDVPNMLERIAIRATDLLPGADMALYLKKQDVEYFKATVVLSKYSEAVKAGTIKLGEGILGFVAQTWSAEIVNYPETDPRKITIPGVPMDGDAPQTLMCAALVSRGEVVGVMALWQPRSIRHFNKADLNFLVGLAQQMVIALENAQLYQEIRREKRLFEALFFNSPVATVMVDFRDHCITSWNPAAETLFGFSKKEALGQNIHALLTSKFDTADPTTQYQILANANQTRTIIQRRRKDGSVVYVELLAVPVIIDGERVTDLVLYHDVTELERARKEVEYINAALSEVNHDLQIMADRMQDELNTAHQIQRRLLPPTKPNWFDLDAICYTAPAREVGGDLYAYHTVSTHNYSRSDLNKYIVAVGDVSGKGMPAALFMAVSMASFQAMVGQGLSPGILLARLDKAIARFTKQTQQNCALVYVELTLPAFQPVETPDNGHYDLYFEGHLRVANAGCIPPYIKRGDGSVEFIDIGGVPLGIGLGAQLGYREISITITKGDLIILTSDGVVEANNYADEMFGFERLEASIQEGPQAGAEAMLNHLKESVYSFTGVTEQHDDLTIVVIEI